MKFWHLHLSRTCLQAHGQSHGFLIAEISVTHACTFEKNHELSVIVNHIPPDNGSELIFGLTRPPPMSPRQHQPKISDRYAFSDCRQQSVENSRLQGLARFSHFPDAATLVQQVNTQRQGQNVLVQCEVLLGGAVRSNCGRVCANAVMALETRPRNRSNVATSAPKHSDESMPGLLQVRL